MILTNHKGLPEPIFRAILATWEKYEQGDHGDITTTRLITPPQIIALSKKYEDKLEMDAMECLFALQGQMLHMMFELATPEGHYAEKRVSTMVNGWKVTGQYDLIDPELTLIDYKYTNVFAYIYGKPEWEFQANVNRWLLYKNGQQVKKLVNWLMFRDFTRSKAGTGKYPEEQMLPIELPMWSLDQAEKYVTQRVMLHQEAQKSGSDQALANNFACSNEERWLTKKTGKWNRCEDYCVVNSHCRQFQADTAEG